ncbi:hypothetical protein KIW84_044648 [Lathyrus oleraceus]|uniref:Arabidopsis retrotransposon Orf1 C-terminal domain-containing protein n=1 Tax=Pisum sativum TaxID=3888 RepID=A0A9D4XLJ7_PEA|nr:hypothetical protein KIW84_044648 [Pisum sativum]
MDQHRSTPLFPQQSRQLSHRAKNRREKKETTEPPPCVIYPKRGKGNAQSKPGKEHGLATKENGFGSRLCEGKEARMPPKRVSKGKKADAESSRPRKRTIRHPNSHDIIFDNPKHEQRMFHVLGMLEFVHCEVPTFERITLEFLSTIEFKLKKGWTGTTMYFGGTMSFRLYNIDHELTVEQLGEILHLPLYGPGSVPDSFDAKTFWLAITGRSDYQAKGAKASGIQNPCFRYAQKVLAFTLFGRGDSTGVATQRELFFLFAMANQVAVSVTAFAADYLGRVGRAAQGGISI